METKANFERGGCPPAHLCNVLLKPQTYTNKIGPLCLHLSATRHPLARSRLRGGFVASPPSIYQPLDVPGTSVTLHAVIKSYKLIIKVNINY